MSMLNVIIDISGSMYTAGKPSVVGFLLSTLGILPQDCGGNAELKKYSWDGSSSLLKVLLEKTAENPTLVITDGYSISDNCTAREVMQMLLAEKERLFVVLCGSDAIDISALKEFRGVRTVNAENIMFAVENLFWKSADSVQETVEDSGENWE